MNAGTALGLGSVTERPLITIGPGGALSLLDLRELWAYRELLVFLTWRDVKVRYKQTLLGGVWALLQPTLPMAVFTLFFGKLARMPSESLPYSLFVLAGLLPWTFFANAVTSSGNSLVGSSNLITKVYFPRMIIPTAAVAAAMVDLAVAFLALGALMAWHGMPLTARLGLLPLFVALTVLFALGVGLWCSALNVRYRDVRHALPFLIQVGMFVSPVVYPLSLAPEKWRWILLVNPMCGIIEGYRSSLFGREINVGATVASVVVTVLLLLFSAGYFRRVEKTFADVV